MASRLLVAGVGIPLLLILYLILPTICLAIFLAVLSALAAYELLGATGFVPHHGLRIAAIIMAFLTPMWFYFDCGSATGMGGVIVYMVILFSMAFSAQKVVKMEHIFGCVFSGIMIPAALSAFLVLADLDHYRFYILLPFFASFCSDAAALFAGKGFGKRKLAPTLSPNKTVEGSIGGVLGSVVGCMIFGIIIRVSTGIMPNLAVFLLFGVCGSAIAQFGDLSFSFAKREFGIKDYGKIFLGHGGVLDRFDSVIFCAPLTAAMVQLLPFFNF